MKNINNPSLLYLAVSIERDLFFKRIMTEKQLYIGAFLDGYFSDKKLSEYNFNYLRLLEEVTKKAKKKYKQYKKQKL